ncbi:hypothetical protein Tco_0773971 [Tanacetum coccineum]|uniref:Uncharacterized protein n=1 Tax=Tanacetum coccineum TaxID=301880 RepID=A0ABQ4ZMA0_9ASTR
MSNFSQNSGTNTDELLIKLLDKLGLQNITNTSTSTASTNTMNIATNTVPVTHPVGSPIAFQTSGPTTNYPGVLYYQGLGSAQQVHTVTPVAQPVAPPGSTGSTVTSGQATTLPHAFTVGTLQDLAYGA